MKALDVAVLGAGGIVARAIVRDLAESDEVRRLRLLDIDVASARQAARAHGGGKASAVEIDARDASLPTALAGCDVLVNAASYRVNLAAMHAALEAGCHYIDLGGLYWMTGRQLELDREFEWAGLLAILGMGSSPGKTNVMAVRAARELAVDTVDELHVSVAGRDPAPAPENGALRVPYALDTLLDEVTMKPVIVVNGAPVRVEPLRAGGRVDFPEPIGPGDTIHTLHSELRTFVDSFGCTRASFRLSLPPELLARLTQLASSVQEVISAAAARAVPPSDRTVSAHVVEATAGRRMARVSALTEPAREWGLGGGVVSTAAPAAAAARLLARGLISARGVRPPERCVDPDDLLPELERRGCTFSIEVREAVRA